MKKYYKSASCENAPLFPDCVIDHFQWRRFILIMLTKEEIKNLKIITNPTKEQAFGNPILQYRFYKGESEVPLVRLRNRSFVYLFFCRNEVVYVGRTKRIDLRRDEHGRKFYDEIMLIEYETHSEWMLHESLLIKFYQPAFNLVGTTIGNPCHLYSKVSKQQDV